jgi:DHA1 family quinolone resistance protein-like MFS transporter
LKHELVAVQDTRNIRLTRVLICLMFLTFAMTSDAVGGVIPLVIAEFGLSMKAAGAFHYVPMTAIACGALLLGFLADALGRKQTLILGLALYGSGSALFAMGHSFGFFVGLLALAGLGISIFKIGGLALVGDVSASTTAHTRMMNTAEGFFAIGSILGPALMALLLSHGYSWKWLYVFAGLICVGLIAAASCIRYPQAPARQDHRAAGLRHTFELLRDPLLLGFSALIMLYVAVEVAIYVWMPTYLRAYRGSFPWLPLYGLTLFFVLRALGRFAAVWLLGRFSWGAVLAFCSSAILACFAFSVIGGVRVGAWLLPLSGLFMATVYPTLNSKGISVFEKLAHGTAAGIILFFTALAAAAGPLAMAAVSDAYGSTRAGFALATVFALLLFLGLLTNWWLEPARHRLLAAEARPAARS